MEYVKSSNSDLKISRIAFGTFPFDEKKWGKISEKKAINLMEKAFREGVNYFNTAPYYGLGRCEELLGKFAAKIGREKILIASKLGTSTDDRPFCLNPKFLEKSIQQIFKRLKTDYLDVCLLHHPDPKTPLEDSLGKMKEFKKRGLVRHLGISNHTLTDFKKAVKIAKIEVLEFYYSLLSRDGYDRGNKVFEFGDKHNLAMTVFKVIERGILTDSFTQNAGLVIKINQSYDSLYTLKRNRKKIADLIKGLKVLAAGIGLSLAQLAIVWVLSKSKNAVALIGFREIEHLREDLVAPEISLTNKQISEINKIVAKYDFS